MGGKPKSKFLTLITKIETIRSNDTQSLKYKKPSVLTYLLHPHEHQPSAEDN